MNNPLNKCLGHSWFIYNTDKHVLGMLHAKHSMYWKLGLYPLGNIHSNRFLKQKILIILRSSKESKVRTQRSQLELLRHGLFILSEAKYFEQI